MTELKYKRAKEIEEKIIYLINLKEDAVRCYSPTSKLVLIYNSSNKITFDSSFLGGDIKHVYDKYIFNINMEVQRLEQEFKAL